MQEAHKLLMQLESLSRTEQSACCDVLLVAANFLIQEKMELDAIQSLLDTLMTVASEDQLAEVGKCFMQCQKHKV